MYRALVAYQGKSSPYQEEVMTKGRWGVLGIAVVLLIVLIKRSHARRVQGLLDQLAEARAEQDLVLAEVYPTKDNEQPYRLNTSDSGTIHTSVGDIKLLPATGYFEGTAIFVYMPEGFTFPDEFAEKFLAATDKESVLQPAPGFSMGGDNDADFMVSAGTDWEAHCRGERGYFKSSPAPRLEYTVSIMNRLLALMPLVQTADNATA
jgi:hypothetical protein